jgi:hypothetical protein
VFNLYQYNNVLPLIEEGGMQEQVMKKVTSKHELERSSTRTKFVYTCNREIPGSGAPAPIHGAGSLRITRIIKFILKR